MICFSSIENCTRYQSSDHQAWPHRGKEGQLRTFSSRRTLLDTSDLRHSNRKTKTHQGSPEHKHKHKRNKESQWIPGLNNPCWVQEELLRRHVQPTEYLGDGRRGMEKQKQKKMTKRTMEGVHYEVHQEKDNQHGVEKKHHKAQQEQKGRRGVGTKSLLRLRNGSHSKPQQEGKGQNDVDIKRKKNTLRLTNGLHYKAWQNRNAVQSNTQQEGASLQHNYDQKTETAKAVSLVASLKACAKDKDLHRGSKIHMDTITMGLLEKNVFIGSALVNMYAKCGAMEKAQEVFDKLPVQNVVSWTVLITGYAQYGSFKEALTRFEQMQLEGYSPDAFTFASILRACTSMGAFKKGKEIHALIAREHSLLVEENIHLGTVLVDMYAKFGALETAQDVFDKLSVHDAVLWTVLIAGYAQHEEGEKALINFERMKLEGFFPDAVTFSCILKACGSKQAAYKGQNIHAQIVRHGLLENNIIIGTALVDMYANCGMLAEAQDSFDRLPARDVVSWSALIAGYAEHGHGEEALKCFERMQSEGFTPDAVSFTRILKIYGSMGASNKGQEIYAQLVRERMLDIHVGTVLVDMYAKCGALEKAEEVFGELQVQDVVLWTALIAGYARHGHDEEALHSFELMQLKGFSPDAVTFASVLKACGSIGAVHKGQKLHAEIVMQGLLENIETALVDMYAHLGMLAEAQKVFDMLVVRDLVSWTVLIAGYAQLGKDKLVFNMLEKMVGEGTQPDSITFIAVLNTCSHKGLVDKGEFYFELISEDSGIVPTSEHHTCMIDLFGRAGHLEMAVAVIEEMPLSANLTLWHTFLGACQKWGNRKLGSWAFEHALEMDEMNPSPYVSLRNIYSDSGSLEDMGEIAPSRFIKANMEETWTQNEV